MVYFLYSLLTNTTTHNHSQTAVVLVLWCVLNDKMIKLQSYYLVTEREITIIRIEEKTNNNNANKKSKLVVVIDYM